MIDGVLSQLIASLIQSDFCFHASTCFGRIVIFHFIKKGSSPRGAVMEYNLVLYSSTELWYKFSNYKFKATINQSICNLPTFKLMANHFYNQYIS